MKNIPLCYQLIQKCLMRLIDNATEDMLEAAVGTIERYRMVNEEEFLTRRHELEREYNDLEDRYKKEYRKQERVIVQLSSELKSYLTDEEQEEN